MTLQSAEDLGLADLSQWPVARVRFPELEEEDRVARLTGTIDCLLAQKEPFAIIWLVARHMPDEEPREDDREAHIWLKRVRDDIREYVRGYAYVAPQEEMRTVLKDHMGKVASKLFSFPIHVTDNEPDALTHAREWIRGKG